VMPSAELRGYGVDDGQITQEEPLTARSCARVGPVRLYRRLKARRISFGEPTGVLEEWDWRRQDSVLNFYRLPRPTGFPNGACP
jgi:hypothetical protein